MHRGSFFDRFARQVARFAGHPGALAAALLLIVLWLLAGPVFSFKAPVAPNALTARENP